MHGIFYISLAVGALLLVFFQLVNSDGENNVVTQQWRGDEAFASEGNKRGVREGWGGSGVDVPFLFEAMGQWTSQGRVVVKAIFWVRCELCFEFWQLLRPICELPTVRRYSNTRKMNRVIPISNILIKKSNHKKIQEHAPGEFLHQA